MDGRVNVHEKPFMRHLSQQMSAICTKDPYIFTSSNLFYGLADGTYNT